MPLTMCFCCIRVSIYQQFISSVLYYFSKKNVSIIRIIYYYNVFFLNVVSKIINVDKKKTVGANTDPWGTPISRFNLLDVTLFTRSLLFLLSKMTQTKYQRTPISPIKSGYQTQSNALERDRQTIQGRLTCDRSRQQ